MLLALFAAFLLPPRQASEAQTRSSSLTCPFGVPHTPHNKRLHSLGFSMWGSKVSRQLVCKCGKSLYDAVDFSLPYLTELPSHAFVMGGVFCPPFLLATWLPALLWSGFPAASDGKLSWCVGGRVAMVGFSWELENGSNAFNHHSPCKT